MTEIERHRQLVKWVSIYGPRARQKRKGVLREAWPEFRAKRGKRRRRMSNVKRRRMETRRIESDALRALHTTTWPSDMSGDPKDFVQDLIERRHFYDRSPPWWYETNAKLVATAVEYAKQFKSFDPIPF